jgi:hypothetical protein
LSYRFSLLFLCYSVFLFSAPSLILDLYISHL